MNICAALSAGSGYILILMTLGLNPYDYLIYIFERAPNADIQNPGNPDVLMPYFFKATARA